MVARARIRGVLLDSGGVLIRPVGGRWNPRIDFEVIVGRARPGIAPSLVASAIAAGDRYMADAAASASRDDYHRAMLAVLSVEATRELLAELSAPIDPVTLVEPFEEVIEVLERLRGVGLRLAVVSDADAGLPQLHDGVGLGGYFSAYAISAVLGCTKPDPRMYLHASAALGLEPADCLFVDDSPPLVDAAIALGYHGCAVLRGGDTTDRVPFARDLWGISHCSADRRFNAEDARVVRSFMSSPRVARYRRVRT